MQEWKQRSVEVRYLLNPAFCGRIVFATIKEYGIMPFPLVYFVLPIILHTKTRKRIKISTTKLHEWIQKNSDVFVDFPKRTRSFVELTNESVEFLLQARLLQISNDGKISCMPGASLNENLYLDVEDKECIRKAKTLGRWLFNAGSVESIYVELGVRP